MNAAIATNLPRLPPPSARGGADLPHIPSRLQADGLRAHVWLEARNFFTRDSAQQFCWLWLLGADARVHALRVPATRSHAAGRTASIGSSLAAGIANGAGLVHQIDGRACGSDRAAAGGHQRFRPCAGSAGFPRLIPGDALQLVREPANPYDDRAVRIDWRGHKLGYVSRGDNADIARRLDSGEPLAATISTVAQQASAWDAVEFEITTAE